jgi:hypothetical protein
VVLKLQITDYQIKIVPSASCLLLFPSLSLCFIILSAAKDLLLHLAQAQCSSVHQSAADALEYFA